VSEALGPSTGGSFHRPHLSPRPNLEIRAYGAYEARDHLKALSYTFVSAGKYWAKAVDAEGFDFESLLAEAWVPAVGRVEVSSDAGELLYSRGI